MRTNKPVELKILISHSSKHGDLLTDDVREAAISSKMDIEDEVERILVEWLESQPIDDDFQLLVEMQPT